MALCLAAIFAALASADTCQNEGHPDVAGILRAHIASVTGWNLQEIEICSVGAIDAAAPSAGAPQLQVAARFMPSSFGKMLVPIEIVAAGGAPRTLWISADVRVRAAVVRLAKRVPYRGILKPEHLELIVADIRDPRTEYVRNPEDAAGMMARRSLAPGELLSRASIETQDLVHSGDTVRLVSKVGGITIATMARALQGGKLGDRVKVRNIDSNQALRALVTGPGEVSIQR